MGRLLTLAIMKRDEAKRIQANKEWWAGRHERKIAKAARELERARKRKLRYHGASDSREYHMWFKARARSKTRGVEFHEPWKEHFLAFYQDMGDCPADCSLQRIDPTRGFVPGNACWKKMEK